MNKYKNTTRTTYYPMGRATKLFIIVVSEELNEFQFSPFNCNFPLISKRLNRYLFVLLLGLKYNDDNEQGTGSVAEADELQVRYVPSQF